MTFEPLRLISGRRLVPTVNGNNGWKAALHTTFLRAIQVTVPLGTDRGAKLGFLQHLLACPPNTDVLALPFINVTALSSGGRASRDRRTWPHVAKSPS